MLLNFIISGLNIDKNLFSICYYHCRCYLSRSHY